jgi:hypothetical protein
MLPLLHLDFSLLCQSALDFSLLDRRESRTISEADIEKVCRTYTGKSFAFRDEELQEHAGQTSQNLDQLLSRHFAYGFACHPVKRKSLLWLGRRFECVIITICDSRGQLDPEWMRAIPAFLESGSDFIGNRDRPYGYWDGHNFHRIYPDIQSDTPGRILVCDFGTVFGWHIEETDLEEEEVVDARLAANPDAWEYSVVPAIHEEVVTVNDSRCLLLHSRYREVQR